MRRSAILSLVAAAAAALSPALASAQSITAPLGRAVRVPLAGAAADVVVGNPKIADVTVVSPTALFVSGRGYGSTNVVVLDATGRTIFNGQIMVPVADDGQITLQRGPKNVGFYFCAPNCDQAVGRDATASEVATATALSTSTDPAPQSAPPAPPPASAAALLR